MKKGLKLQVMHFYNYKATTGQDVSFQSDQRCGSMIVGGCLALNPEP